MRGWDALSQAFTVMAEEHPPSPEREDDTIIAREIAGQARNDGKEEKQNTKQLSDLI